MYVGNDIVAYKHLRCIGKWKDERFLQKILETSEVEQLQLQINKDAFLWTLWTMKEAAYKLSCFLGNRNKFHSKQFLINSIPNFTNDFVQKITFNESNKVLNKENTIAAEIIFEDKMFYGKTLLGNELVHSLVTDVFEPENMHWAIAKHSKYNKNDYSNEVRQFATEQLKMEGIKIDAIEKDENGIPFVQINGMQNYISLSHDQQFVAFAFTPILHNDINVAL